MFHSHSFVLQSSGVNKGAIEDSDPRHGRYGFKGTDKDMRGYRKFQYKLDEWYIHKGKVSTCISGFHLCEDLIDVFYHYRNPDNRYFIVEYEGNCDSDNDKIAVSKIRLIKEIDHEEILKHDYPSTLNEYKAIGDCAAHTQRMRISSQEYIEACFIIFMYKISTGTYKYESQTSILKKIDHFIQLGVNISIANNFALTCVCIYRNIDMIDFILKKINDKDSGVLNQKLVYSISLIDSFNGSLDIIKHFVDYDSSLLNDEELIERLISSLQSIPWHILPKHIIEDSDVLPIFEYLIQKSKEIFSPKDHLHNCILNYAIHKEFFEVIKLLVKEGFIISPKDAERILRIAIPKNKLEIVEMFIDQVPEFEKSHTGALIIACDAGCFSIFKFLVERGNARRWSGKCMRIAYKKGWKGIQIYLFNHIGNDSSLFKSVFYMEFTSLKLASANGYLKIVEQMIDHYNSLDVGDITPDNYKQHYLLSKDAEFISNNCTDKETKERYYRSTIKIYINDALIKASNNGRMNVVRYLIEKHNADPSYRNHNSILSAACNGYEKIVRYLYEQSIKQHGTIDDFYLKNKRNDIVHMLDMVGYISRITKHTKTKKFIDVMDYLKIQKHDIEEKLGLDKSPHYIY